LKKSGAKNFYYAGPWAECCQRPDPELKKVFWFFFSKKNRFPSSSLKQFLSDIFALGDAWRAGEDGAADMRGELVQRVDFRHFIEKSDESGARIFLVGLKE
jgi:hypothetical protein